MGRVLPMPGGDDSTKGVVASCGARSEVISDLEAAAAAAVHASPTLFLLADVDGFRRYNARYGYARGDALLSELGSALARTGRAYHLGADSFAVLLDGTPLELAAKLAAVIDALTVRQPEPIHCSVGIAVLPLEDRSVNALALAEQRLEEQRRRGLVYADRISEVMLTLMSVHQRELRTHADGVAKLTDAVGHRLGLGIAERSLARRAAELHDLGKLAISRDVLEKASPLTDGEWAEIRLHTVRGEELLRPVEALASAAPVVRATHERYDGAGYPDGASGEGIPLGARIVAACDAFHAMISERPYAKQLSPAEACAELEACAGTQFDPVVVAALVAEITDQRMLVGEALGGESDDVSLHGVARLHALLESASLVEHPDELPRALDAVARVVGESLNFGAVVINLYRHEWDDFIVSTVHGDDPDINGLLGSTYGWQMWERLLDPRFLRSGVYTVYKGEYDWEEQSGHRIVPNVTSAADPEAWQAEDEIFVPFRHTDGHILGIFNVALPRSGRRPSDEELHVLKTVVQHAARAVQRAQAGSAAADHRRTLEHLLEISSTLTETVSGTSVLETISVGISEALGFNRVIVHLYDPGTDALLPAAVVGFDLEDPRVRLPFGLAELRRIFEPRYEIAGCYLVPLEEAKEQLPSLKGLYESTYNGTGPWAWRRHWLVVPLFDGTGACLGVIFADDPADRLLPSTERLQALRLFANQATVALEGVAQYERQRYLAEHDSLTKLRNRHSFMLELESAVDECRSTGQQLALVYVDLDAFKQLNDAGGHAVGDQALACFGEVLAESVREGSAFRLGGDEFAMLLRSCGPQEARLVVDRTVAAWAEAAGDDRLLRSLAASFGIAVLDEVAIPTAVELLRRADEAMYQAKRSQNVLAVVA
jgi:diguanylate cyclase (GGDEF)-like protein